MKLAALKDQEITIVDFIELDSKQKAGGKYILAQAIHQGKNIVFNSSPNVIMEKLLKAKPSLPVKGTIREIKSQKGPYSYWDIQ